MKKLWIVLALISIHSFAGEKVIISVGTDSLNAIISKVDPSAEVLKEGRDITLLSIEKSATHKLSDLMHEKFGRCPGYTQYFSASEAYEELGELKIQQSVKGLFTLNYEIDQKLLVEPMVKQIDEVSLVQVIAKLSSYKTRYHKSQTGTDAVNWVKDHWSSLAAGRSDIHVDLFTHKKTPQPSVIITFEGSENPEEIIVVGGHVDSIAKSFFGTGKEAPGADDNASGIATMSEVIRVLVQNDYRSKKTIKFMAYAAEEVGLVGSREIATEFKRAGANVIGVMQLDMTNFKGSEEDIVLMTDYTNEAQNNFVTSLIDTYVKVKWGTDRCGYACSDHASWTNAGFPASVPFESKVRDMNKAIHTKRDTLAITDGHAFHAVNFAKLALSYVVELDQ